MQLTIDALSKKGGFVGAPVKKQVEWVKDGETFKFDVYVRPMNYHTAVKDVENMRSGADIVASRIAYCICHEDGSPVFRVSDITGIDEEGNPIMVKEKGKLVERGPLCKALTDSLLVLISEVSGLGKKSKSSAPSKNSGTNSSPQESEEEQS